jgi:hypothetical protein
MLKAGGAGDERGALRPVEKLSPMPVQPYLFAVARFVWSRGRDRTFLATPNVVAFHRRFGSGAGGGLTRRTIFDIVANEVAVRPGAAKDGSDGFRLRLEQGVVDSNLESQLVTARPPEEGGVKVNTADLFARSEAQGVKWVTVRGAGADAALSGVSLGDDVKQRVKDDLAAGYAVVVPTKPVEAGGVKAGGWWRVDPRTGNVLGMTEAGGATFAEYALQITASLAVGVWTFIGCGGLTGSGPKKLGCAVCAVAAAVLTYLAFAAGFAAAAAAAGEAAPTGAVASAATAVGTTGGAAGVGGVNVACNALSGLAS